MNEAKTRAELIDPLRTAAGWGVVEGSRIRREYSITPGRIEGGGRRGKPLTADYVLTYRNTQLAVVEAKANTSPLTEGVAQAKDYAGKLQLRNVLCPSKDHLYWPDLDIDLSVASIRNPSEFPLLTRMTSQHQLG